MWVCLVVIFVYVILFIFYFIRIEKIFEKVEYDELEMMIVI